jgi:hypothetical protein
MQARNYRHVKNRAYRRKEEDNDTEPQIITEYAPKIASKAKERQIVEINKG